MPSFEYQAVNPLGQSESGTVLGMNLADAVQQLSGKGLKVEKIHVAEAPPTGNPYETPLPPPRAEPVGPPPPTDQRSYFATSVAGPLVGKVSSEEQMFFYRQLSTMLNAGVPIVQSMDTLAGQARSPKLQAIIQELKGHVQAGRKISDGMQRYPEVFTVLQISMVRAGEEAGFLSGALSQVADYMEREIELRNMYRKATFMPKVTIGASILIIGGANWFIASQGKESMLSSPLTNIVTWLFLGPIIIGLFLFFRLGLANPGIKAGWDKFILKIPYVGHTLQQFAMAKFGRAFGALYKGGVPIHKSLKLSADACGNEYLRARIYPAVARLESGAGISETLRETGAFSPIVLDMMSTGESTGGVDQMMSKMADFYEDEAEVRSKQTGQIVSIVLFLLVAFYVLVFVLIPFYSNMASHYQDAASEN